MKKIDPSLVVEIFGVVLVTVGIAAFSLPLAAIALGSFIVWDKEKASKLQLEFITRPLTKAQCGRSFLYIKTQTTTLST